MVDLATAITTFDKLIDLKASEINLLNKISVQKLTSDEHEAWTRIYSIQLCSLIEASLFCIRNFMLTCNLPNLDNLSDAEINIVKEESYILKDNGSIGVRTQRQNMKNMTIFTLEMFHKYWEEEYKIDKSDGGWEAYCHLIEFRNNQTHPKDIEKMTISDDELDKLVEGKNWFEHHYFQLLKLAKYHANQIRKHPAKAKDT